MCYSCYHVITSMTVGSGSSDVIVTACITMDSSAMSTLATYAIVTALTVSCLRLLALATGNRRPRTRSIALGLYSALALILQGALFRGVSCKGG